MKDQRTRTTGLRAEEGNRVVWPNSHELGYLELPERKEDGAGDAVRADEHPEAAHEQPVVDRSVRFATPKEEELASAIVPAALSKLQRDAAATKLGSVDYREDQPSQDRE